MGLPIYANIDPQDHPNVGIYMAYMECLGWVFGAKQVEQAGRAEQGVVFRDRLEGEIGKDQQTLRIGSDGAVFVYDQVGDGCQMGGEWPQMASASGDLGFHGLRPTASQGGRGTFKEGSGNSLDWSNPSCVDGRRRRRRRP